MCTSYVYVLQMCMGISLNIVFLSIYSCTHIINAFPHVADMHGDSLLVDYLKCCETK
jgi:hypothetical protein